MPIGADWIEFTLPNIKALALKESGVYEVGKKQGNIVLYIGQSDTSIRSRLLDHKEKAKFHQVCTHFRMRRTRPEDAENAEKRLMDAFCKVHDGKRPKLNIQKPTMKNSSRRPHVLIDKIRPLI